MTSISTLKVRPRGKEGRPSIQKEQEGGNRDSKRPQQEASGDTSASSSQACHFHYPVLQVTPSGLELIWRLSFITP